MLNDSSAIPKGSAVLLLKSQDTRTLGLLRVLMLCANCVQAVDQLSNSGIHVSLCC